MARPRRHALFATAIGECAIAWNDAGLTGIWLPADVPGTLRRALRRRWPEAVESEPDADVAEVVAAIVRLLAGERVGFTAARLDLSDTAPFERRVYAATREIAAGDVITYGELAARIGDAGAARAVGQALGRNPWPIVVPCHRVVAAGNRLGGFSAPGGSATKRRLLAIEGARRAGAPELFDVREDDRQGSRASAGSDREACARH